VVPLCVLVAWFVVKRVYKCSVLVMFKYVKNGGVEELRGECNPEWRGRHADHASIGLVVSSSATA
jgi:hypothetical protein